VDRQDSSFDFDAYLEAKFAVDSQAINATVFHRFARRLAGETDPRILDLGTGTGAMLRRILDLELPGGVRLVGLDRELRGLAAGRKRIEQALKGSGYETSAAQTGAADIRIFAEKEGASVQVDLLRRDFLNRGTIQSLGSFDCVTAQAFMDLVPLKPAVRSVRGLLKAGGMFYCPLNYDGLTVLLPQDEDPAFERRLLAIYNGSMERRRVAGKKTGGAWSGRRLYQALCGEGFVMLGVGSSDWNVAPSGGSYSAGQPRFLDAIVSMIEQEARSALDPVAAAGPAAGAPAAAGPAPEAPAAGRERLGRWYARRKEQLRQGRLALVVHQLDLLAAAPGEADGGKDGGRLP
jgi:SAM-dependent methyltransferase